MRKRILSLLLTMCTVLSLMAVPAAAADTVNFADISDRDTAMAVESLRLMGVLDGYGDGSFRPGATLTRAQFCKMAVYAMDGADELGRYSTVTVFPDVKPSHWASAYINMVAKGKNIISGYTDGNFHPNDTVTVGQAVTILLRLLGYKDENIGGIWPQSYMAQAATIGLTDGVGTNGYAGLTRGQAARLFLNLLRADMAEGGAYAATLGTPVNDAMLVSSTASAPNGQPNALQLSTGAVYPLASGKTSSGALNGHKGTLIVDKDGKALTFVPDGVGSNKTITLASASATEITDINGIKYVVPGGVSVFYDGKESAWSETYSWLNIGSSVTLYLSAAGVVEYIFVGGGGTSNAAVIVYEDGSTAGFDALGGGSGIAIYKNGVLATAADMREYDVATYSAATNTIRVTDTRLTGYYENCSPNPKEPSTITVLGHEFNVLPTARETVAQFKPGDQVTLLLTEDNQVAGAVEASGNIVRSNAVGIATSVSSSEATVELLCGITVKGKVVLNAGQVENLEGQMVRIGSSQKGVMSITRLTGGPSGDLDVNAKKLGTRDLADNVMIFRSGPDGMLAVSLSQLTSAVVSSDDISYVRTNWAGDVDLIVFGSSVGSSYVYGRAVFEDGDRTVIGADGKEEVIHGNNKITLISGSRTYGPYETGYEARNGECIGLAFTGAGSNKRIASLVRLQGVQVSNDAWSGKTAVTVNGRTYTVLPDVPCYNLDTQEWVTLNEAHAYATVSTIYIHNGAVRLIEVGG